MTGKIEMWGEREKCVVLTFWSSFDHRLDANREIKQKQRVSGWADVKVNMWGHSLDDCAFGAPCSGEHDPGGEADSQVVLVQAQELGTVFQSLTGLVLQNAATWDQMQIFNGHL